MDTLRRLAAALDRAVFQLERALLVVSLAMMTLLVSLDVLQRTFSRPVGKTAQLVLFFFADPSPERHPLVVDWVAPGLFGVFSFVFLVAAAHASRAFRAQRAEARAPLSWWPSLVVGASLWLGAALFIRGFLWLYPSSLPGAQKFALGFMLWSGLLGASLATRARRHIMLDAVVKKLDPGTKRWFGLLGAVAAAGFCALFAGLGVLQWLEQFRDWASGDGIGVYDALPIPTWLSTLAVPVTFGVMAARFLGNGVRDFVWGPPTGGVDAHGLDLNNLTSEPSP